MNRKGSLRPVLAVAINFGTRVGFDLPRASPTLDQIETHYRNLAAANGWEMTKPAHH
jgi:hypothetical protein